MVLVLFLCIVLFLFILLVSVTLISTIEVKIRNIEVSNIKNISSNYVINISIKLLNAFKWMGIYLDNNKVKKISKKIHLEKINIQKLEKNLRLSDIKKIINIKPKISSLHLNIDIGLEYVILTSYAVAGVSSVIAVILPLITKKDCINNVKYKISPIFNNQNVYHIDIDTSFEIKVLNIINSLYKIYRDNKYIEDNKKVSRRTLQNV